MDLERQVTAVDCKDTAQAEVGVQQEETESAADRPLGLSLPSDQRLRHLAGCLHVGRVAVYVHRCRGAFQEDQDLSRGLLRMRDGRIGQGLP